MLMAVPLEESRTDLINVGAYIVTAIAVVLTLVSYAVSINEYVSVFGGEMAGAYDCDGPSRVLALATGGVVLGLVGVLWSGRAVRRSRAPATLLALGIAAIVVCVATARIVPAIAEARRNAGAASPCH
jgi:hypothetical protein